MLATWTMSEPAAASSSELANASESLAQMKRLNCSRPSERRKLQGFGFGVAFRIGMIHMYSDELSAHHEDVGPARRGMVLAPETSVCNCVSYVFSSSRSRALVTPSRSRPPVAPPSSSSSAAAIWKQ